MGSDWDDDEERTDLVQEYDTVLEILKDVARMDADEDASDVDDDLVRQLTNTAERAIATQLTPPPTPAAAPSPPPPPELAGGPPEALDRLARHLQLEAAASTSPRRAAMLMYELGRLYEGRGQLDLALEAYRQSHARFPGFPLCARALVRQLALRGDYAACVPVLEAELNAVSSVDERVAVLTERALIRSHHLSDPDEALEDLRRAQKMAPDDIAVNDALIEGYRRTGEARELEGLLRRRSRSTSDPGLASAMLCEVAHLRAGRIGDLGGAATLYRAAVDLAPTNLHALYALLRTARSSRDYPAVASLCEALAQVESGPAAAAAHWAAARIYRDRLGKPELAVAALERALEHAPEERALLIDLAELYEQAKHWEALATTLERGAHLSGDSAESGVLLFRLGQVRHERLQNPEGAVTALHQAMSAAPDNIPARRLLGRLYTKLDRHEELLGQLSDELEIFTDPDHRAAIAFRIGHLYETKLGNPERAVEAYEQAVEIQPSYRPALRGVTRVYAALGRFEDLVACYERELGQAADREDRLLLLRRISEVWERKLGDPAAALSAYERLVSIDPSNLPALRALHRLYAMGGRWRDLVGVLKADADQAMDRWRRVTLLTEAAEIQERQLGEQDAALATYLEVLELAPCHQPALMAAGRILYRKERHDDLLRLHQRELEQVEDPSHRIWLLMKQGRLLWEKLGRPTEAAAVYTEAMQLAARESPPDRAPVLSGTQLAAADQLFRIYRQIGDEGSLLQVLQSLPVPQSGRTRSLHHRRIAEVLQHGQRPALAVEHLRRALDASKDDAALYQLAQIYASIGDRQSLIALHLQEAKSLEDPRGLMAVFHKLARLWGEAEYDLERAVGALERILEIDPRNQVALHQLEVQLARLEHWGKLTAVLELSREPSEDLDYKVACALEVAALKEDRLDDLPGAAHSAFEVLGRFPTHPEALATLEHHHRRASNAEGLIQVLGRQLETAQSSAEQAAILASIGSAHARTGELAEAIKAFRAAVRTAPDYLPAVRGWRRAAQTIGYDSSIAEALQAEARASREPVRQAACLFEAGCLWQRCKGCEEKAVAAFGEVLELDPTHQAALDELTAMHTARKEWPQLVQTLQGWVQHLEDPRKLKGVLARIGDLQRSRLGDLPGARRTLHQALEIDPDDQPLLTTLAELCRAEGDWEALVRVNLRLLELTSDSIMVKALHFELGTIWEEKLPDTGRAIAGYKRVLELDPNDLGALTRLSTLLLRERDWKGAAQTTKLLLQRDDDRNRVKGYHLRLAGIYTEGFGDVRQAVESCRRALSLDPGDLAATELMAKLLAKAQDNRALDAHLASTLAVHRARLDRDPFRIESYRALQKVFEWQRASDPIYVVHSVLATIGAADQEDRASVETLRSVAPRTPARPLTPEEVEEVLPHADERGPLHRVMTIAEPPLRKLFPPVERTETRAEKLTVRSHPELAEMLGRLRKALGGVSLNAYVVEGGPEMLRVEDTSTPTLYIGREMERDLSHEELAYLLARKVAHVRLGHTLYGRFEPGELGRVVAAVLAVVCSSFVPPFPPEELEEVQVRFHRALTKRTRRLLESPALDLSDRNIDPVRWRVAMDHSEDRVALAICGDIPASLSCMLREECLNLQGRLDQPDDFAKVAGPRMRQLLSFAISEEYLTLRERVGMALSPEG